MKKTNGKEFIAKNRIIVGIALMLCAILLILLVIPQISGGEKYNVIVVNTDLEAGTILTAEVLGTTTTTDETVAATAFAATDDVVGMKISTDIPQGSYLYKSCITETDNVVPTRENKLLMPLPIQSVSMAYMSMIGKYDIVQFIAEVDKKITTPEELIYVEVCDIQDADGVSVSESGGAAENIVLYVSQQQAIKLLEICNGGKTNMLFVADSETENAQALLKMQDAILKVVYGKADSIIVDLSPYGLRTSDFGVSVAGASTSNSTAEKTHTIYTAKRNIPAGTKITMADLTAVSVIESVFNAQYNNDYLFTSTELDNITAKTDITAGSYLTKNDVAIDSVEDTTVPELPTDENTTVNEETTENTEDTTAVNTTDPQNN